MKSLNARMLVLLVTLGVLGLIGTDAGVIEIPVDNARAARALAFRELLGSIEGTPREAPRIYKAEEGYLRFVGAPPSTHFPVDPNRWATPQEAADAFLEEYRNLFVNVSPAVEFQTLRVDTRDSLTYVRYQQTFAGLKVFGAEMVIQVNAAGGIDAVMSDIMRDTKVLDTGAVSLNPTIDLLTAESKAIKWLAAQHEQVEFEASDGTLMIFYPPVVGWKGPTKLVWHINVRNVGELRLQEFVLVDAHDGTIAFNYSRICYALNREVFDDETDTTYYEEHYPTEIEEVNLAFEYLEDTWWFFKNHHDRDGYDGSGNEPEEAWVNYDGSTSWWGDHMRLESGDAIDDIVGHEFAHGVSNTNPCNLGYTFNEAGAICEMFCDIWGEFIDQNNLVSKTGNDQPGDKWLMFEDIVDEEPWRNMKDPPDPDMRQGPAPDRLYGEHWYPLCTEGVDCDCPDAPPEHGYPGRYCFTHRNNGVGNKLCYLLTDGSGDEPGGKFNGHTTWGMGIPTVSDLFYKSQYILPSQCDYYNLYNALTQVAITPLGLSQDERDNLEQGCRAVEIAPNLMGWWKFDDGSGQTASDSSGYGRHGQRGSTPEADSNDPAWVVDDPVRGRCLDFDGGDYVSIEPIPTLRSDKVTISAWIKRNPGDDGWSPIVRQYNESQKGYYFCLHNGRPKLYLGGDHVQSREDINKDIWYHIAGTYDGDELKIYVDGGPPTTNPVGGLTGVYDDAYIGGRGTHYFKGKIDDVRVYNYALDMFEIWDAMSGDASRFRVKNSSGETVAWFDNLGNLFLKGSLTTGGGQTRPTATDDDEFIFKDSNGNLMIINTTNGNMDIYGVHGVWPGPGPLELEDEFVIKGPTGVVAYINASGNLYLKGELYHNPE